MASLQCLHVNAGRMRKSRSNWRSVCTAGLQSCLHHRNMVENLPWLECCNGWIQALCKGQAGTERRNSCEWERAAATHRVLPRTGGQLSGSLWVRIRGQTSVGSIVVDVCYKLSDMWEVDKSSSASWKKTHTWRPCSSWGVGNTQMIYCRNTTAEHKQS